MKWVRLYWFGMFSLVVMALFVLRTCHLLIFGNFQSYNTETFIWMGVTVGIAILSRIQLLALPSLIVLEDLSPVNWDTLHTTPLTPWQLMSVIFKHVMLVGVLPVTLLLFAEIFVIGAPMAGTVFVYDISTDFISLFLAVVGFIFYGLSLSAIGMIFGVLIRRPFGAVIGVISPLIGVIVITIYTIFTMALFSDFSNTSYILVEFLFTLVIPEGFYAQIWSGITVNGPIGASYELWELVLYQGIGAVVLWGILYFVISKRLWAR